MAAQLATLASKRLMYGFRLSTLQQYQHMWKDFVGYQVVARLRHYHVNTDILLSFMEFLHSNGLSANHIANYMAALTPSMMIEFLCS